LRHPSALPQPAEKITPPYFSKETGKKIGSFYFLAHQPATGIDQEV
jgi:hypothetical protein